MPKHVAEVQKQFKIDKKTRQQLLKMLPHEKLIWMSENMLLTQYFEENAENLYIRG